MQKREFVIGKGVSSKHHFCITVANDQRVIIKSPYYTMFQDEINLDDNFKTTIINLSKEIIVSQHEHSFEIFQHKNFDHNSDP